MTGEQQEHQSAEVETFASFEEMPDAPDGLTISDDPDNDITLSEFYGLEDET